MPQRPSIEKNHWCLFKKLAERDINIIIIRLLGYWYSNQTFVLDGVILTLSFSLYLMVFAKVVLCPPYYLIYAWMISVLD